MNLATRALCAAIVCLLLTQPGCGPTVKDRLVGKWTGTVEFDQAAIDQKKKESGNPLGAVLVEQALKAAVAGAQVDLWLKVDDTCERSGTGIPAATGTWSINSNDGEQAIVQVVIQNVSTQYTITFDPDFMSGKGGFSTPLQDPLEGLGRLRFKRSS